jgi:hypothetical protein
VINKTFETLDYEVQLQHPQGELRPLGEFSRVPPQGSADGRFLIILSEAQMSGSQTDLTFEVFANGEKVETITSGFIGPGNNGDN